MISTISDKELDKVSGGIRVFSTTTSGSPTVVNVSDIRPTSRVVFFSSRTVGGVTETFSVTREPTQ